MIQQPAQELVAYNLADWQQFLIIRFVLIVAIFRSITCDVSHFGFRQRQIIFRLMWATPIIKPDELVSDEPEVAFTEEN